MKRRLFSGSAWRGFRFAVRLGRGRAGFRACAFRGLGRCEPGRDLDRGGRKPRRTIPQLDHPRQLESGWRSARRPAAELVWTVGRRNDQPERTAVGQRDALCRLRLLDHRTGAVSEPDDEQRSFFLTGEGVRDTYGVDYFSAGPRITANLIFNDQIANTVNVFLGRNGGAGRRCCSAARSTIRGRTATR